MKKIIFRLFIFTLLFIFGFVTYISTIGIKTDAFNNQISKEVKKINNQLELDLDKVSNKSRGMYLWARILPKSC